MKAAVVKNTLLEKELEAKDVAWEGQVAVGGLFTEIATYAASVDTKPPV